MVAFIIVIAWYLCRGSYRLHKISRDAHNKRHECAHIVAYNIQQVRFLRWRWPASENIKLLAVNVKRISHQHFISSRSADRSRFFIHNATQRWLKKSPLLKLEKRSCASVSLSLRRTFHAAVAALQFMQESFCDPCRCVFSWPCRFLSLSFFLARQFFNCDRG
jgi:hypothetical protein